MSSWYVRQSVAAGLDTEPTLASLLVRLRPPYPKAVEASLDCQPGAHLFSFPSS
jgi:hypothetical protein